MWGSVPQSFIQISLPPLVVHRISPLGFRLDDVQYRQQLLKTLRLGGLTCGASFGDVSSLSKMEKRKKKDYL